VRGVTGTRGQTRHKSESLRSQGTKGLDRKWDELRITSSKKRSIVGDLTRLSLRGSSEGSIRVGQVRWRTRMSDN